MFRRRFCVLVPVFLLCAGCVVFNRDNTPVLNAVEKHLLPEDGLARKLWPAKWPTPSGSGRDDCSSSLHGRQM